MLRNYSKVNLMKVFNKKKIVYEMIMKTKKKGKRNMMEVIQKKMSK